MTDDLTDDVAHHGGTFRAAVDVESAVVAGELCLLEPEQSQLFILNESAQAVWQLATSGADIDEMVAQLATLFGSDADVVRDGVQTILDQLEQRHLLVREA